MDHPDNAIGEKCIRNPEVEIYRNHDIDTENAAIQKIEDIFTHLGLPVLVYTKPNLTDFNF